MAKLLKCKTYVKEYYTSVLTGVVILLGFVALAASMHHSLAIGAIFTAISVTIYCIWRSI